MSPITDLFHDLFRDLINGDWVEKIISFTILSLMLAVIFFIGWFIFTAIDSSGSVKSANGVVVGRSYNEAYSTTTMVMSGKVMVPITTFHPESWNLIIKFGERTVELSVDKEMYNLENGVTGTVEYSEGLISDSFYPKTFTPNK